MNGKDINYQNTNFFSNFIHGIFNNRELPFERRDRLEILAKDIKRLLKKKETIEIPEIMKELNVSAIDAIAAVKILRERGIVREAD